MAPEQRQNRQSPPPRLHAFYSNADLISFGKKVEYSGCRVSVELDIDKNRGRRPCRPRGNGRIGNEKVRTWLLGRGVVAQPLQSASLGLGNVRDEVCILPDNFGIVQRNTPMNLCSPRNAATGAVKKKNHSEEPLRRPQFVSYECLEQSSASATTDSGDEDDEKFCSVWPTQGETLTGLAEWGFGAMPKFAAFDTVADAGAFVAEMETARAQLPFEAAGVVLKIDDSRKRAALGRTPRRRAAPPLSCLPFLPCSLASTPCSGVAHRRHHPVADRAPVVLGGGTVQIVASGGRSCQRVQLKTVPLFSRWDQRSHFLSNPKLYLLLPNSISLFCTAP